MGITGKRSVTANATRCLETVSPSLAWPILCRGYGRLYWKMGIKTHPVKIVF